MAFNIQKIHQIQKRGAQLSPCYHKCESPIKPPPPPGPRLDVSANGIRIGRFLLTHFVRVRIMEQANVRDVRDGTIASQQRPSSTDPLRSPVSSRSLFLVLLICLPGFSSVNPLDQRRMMDVELRSVSVACFFLQTELQLLQHKVKCYNSVS